MQALVVAAALLPIATATASAQTETVLYNYPRPNGSSFYSNSALVQDAAGNFYGTTRQGGVYNLGTVFKMAGDGTVTVIHSFSGAPNDGDDPEGGLVIDSKGTLYGTTENGGASNFGTIFRISPIGEEKVLYEFTGGEDGGIPSGELLFDRGNLYGIVGNGDLQYGAIFELESDGTFAILYRFQRGTGISPSSRLLRDTDGNLYGTFGPNPGGVFKFSPNGQLSVLYNFTGGADGAAPTGGLIWGANGDFFGTTSLGGRITASGKCVQGCGVVFHLTADGTETVLHTFDGQKGGLFPMGGVVRDLSGNFYGTTSEGGDLTCRYLLGGQFGYLHGCGVVFKLWRGGKFTVLHNFTLGPQDGFFPTVGLSIDSAQNLYGTTWSGGTGGEGVIFEIPH
jgi:uncharacterized repeat protein (TIGR03803 family)